MTTGADKGKNDSNASEPVTMCEDQVRRLSLDETEENAESNDLVVKTTSSRPPKSTLRRGDTSQLSTMLEAVSPRSSSDQDVRRLFKSSEMSEAVADQVESRTLRRNAMSMASIYSTMAVSPPRVHMFTSALIEDPSPTKRTDLPTPEEKLVGKTSTSAPNDGASPEVLPKTLDEFKEQFNVDNPKPQSIPPPIYGDQGIIGEKHVLVMVGLPARGKTHMAKRLCQYLRFFHGANTRVFNVGEYRRRFAGAGQTADFFTKENKAQRMKFAQEALKDMIDFLFQEDSMSNLEQRGVDSGRVAIFDATNSTKERRRWLVNQIGSLPLKLLFIESICTDEKVVEHNVRVAKITNRDYHGIMSPKRAFKDFMQRMKNYEQEYEPMGVDDAEADLSFIKLIDCGRRVEFNLVHGFLLGRVAQFLSNMHATTCSIYLSRHGQSEYNACGKIGGDSNLSAMGEAYALKLADFADRIIAHDADSGDAQAVRLWTSSLLRTKNTARHIKHAKIKHDGKDWIQFAPRVLRNLDEIYAGVCDGMTYEEIQKTYPHEYEMRRQNKLAYRYPRGESYLDVIARLDPLIQELESYREDILIVGHQGVLRLIYAYFAGLDRDEAATLSIPLNTVIKLTPRTHDCIEERFLLHDPTKNAEPIDPPSY